MLDNNEKVILKELSSDEGTEEGEENASENNENSVGDNNE